MNVNDLTIKIKEHFVSSDEQNRTNGITWYERAHNECLLLSQVFELPLSKVVGVVAALSPNNKWNRNLKDAWNFLDAPSLDTKVCTFIPQRKKALAILASDGTDESIQGILNGAKTKNFYENIMYYNVSDVVTVDTWAYRSVDVKPSVKNFRTVEMAYKKAANDLNLMPHQVQAVVWGVVRGGTE